MRASDKEAHGNEKPGCINIIARLRALLRRVDLKPCSSPGQLGGKRRRADVSTARAVLNASFLLPWTSELPKGLSRLFESEMSGVRAFA